MVASRVCSLCEELLPKSSYSNNQWSKKKKDGSSVHASKCKSCVARLEVVKAKASGSTDGGEDRPAAASAKGGGGASNSLPASTGCNNDTLNKAMEQISVGQPIAKESEDKASTTAAVMKCASCGNTQGNLKLCTGCKQVRYCDRTCQKAHRKTHREACKRIEEVRNNLSSQLGEDDDDDNNIDPIVCHDCLSVFSCQSQLHYHKKLGIACFRYVDANDDGTPLEDEDVRYRREENENDEQELHDILADIEICEILLKPKDDDNDDDDDDEDGGDMFEQLDLQKKHWLLCYRREEQLEEIRMRILHEEWEKNDRIQPTNVDGDNMKCILCSADMPLDGEELDEFEEDDDSFNSTSVQQQFFLAKRFLCCGARYCPSHAEKDLPAKCPDCKAPCIMSQDTYRDHLYRHANESKSWAQLELAKCFDDHHPAFIDEAKWRQNEHYYENEAIQWARKAADAGNIHSIILLGEICHSGGIATASNQYGAYEFKTFYDIPERQALMKRAADTGDPKSMLRYAEYAEYWIEPRSESMKYWTMMAYFSSDERVQAKAYRNLAEECEQSGGPPERVLYLYEQASMPDDGGENGDPLTQARFAYCLNEQSTERFGSDSFPKYSVLPKMYYWANKSATAKCSEGITLLEEIKGKLIDYECVCLQYNMCSNGGAQGKGKKKNKGKKKGQGISPCKRCGTAYFCSNECRTIYDNVIGHRDDCCDCPDCEKGRRYMGFGYSASGSSCERSIRLRLNG